MNLYWLPFVELAVPSMLCVLLAVVCTGWRRWVAVAILVPVGGVFAFESYSASQGGNLTGLFCMLTTPGVLVGLLILFILEWLKAGKGDIQDN